MSTSSINSVAPVTTSVSNTSAPLPSQTLNQGDFLKLLVAQMSAQDPLSPMSNTDFAAQMAQFSALQTSQATQTAVAQLHTDQQLAQANGLLGRTVTLQVNPQTTANGVVQGVSINSGIPQIVVNGTAYDLDQVVAILPAPVTN